jgi:hypothetical protein
MIHKATFDEVISVRRLSEAETCDITITGRDHTYIAEGLVTHNSTGADIMDTGMARMDDRLFKYKEAYPILQIHDAAAYEIWEDDVDAFKKDLKETYEQSYGGIPFPIDIKVSSTWAEV